MISTILVATDFSELSNASARHAVQLAKLAGAKVVLLHVSDPPFLLGDNSKSLPRPGGIETEHWGDTLAREKLAELSAEIAAGGVDVDVRFAEGKPALRIEEAATELRAGLLVMGTHGYRGAQRMLLGSVAAQVVRHVRTPTLTIPPDGLPSPVTDVSHIVLATDFSSAADQATEHAAFWAKMLGAHVTVLHALDRPSTYVHDPLRREYPPFSESEKLATALGGRAEVVAHGLREAGVDASSLLVQGPAADCTIATAVDLRAGLIVMGARGHTPIQTLFLGSSADRVLRMAEVAVLTCPPTQGVTDVQ